MKKHNLTPHKRDCDKQSFIDRIKQIINELGSAAKLARLANLSGAVIGKYLAGESEPSRPRLISIADASKVNIEWLVSGTGNMRGGDHQLKSIYNSDTESFQGKGFGESITSTEDYCEMPFFDSADNNRALASERQVFEMLRFRKSWLKCEFKAEPQDMCLLRFHGEYMSPTLVEGEITLIDKRETKVTRDGIYFIRVNDENFIKRLQPLPGGNIRVYNDNPSYKPFIVHPLKHSEDFSVLGRVVWAWGGRTL